jgi:hypothetical protein
MTELLKFLNQHSAALTVLFTAAVTLSTVIYAILTGILVWETRRMREAQTEPKIDISLHPREDWINWIDLEIRNIGLGAAYDIQFTVTAETNTPATQAFVAQLVALNMIHRGLRYLSPRRELRTFFTSMADDFEAKSTARFRIHAKYQNASKKTYEDTYVLDFSEMVGLHQLGEPPMYRIASSLEAVQCQLQQVMGSGRQRVNAFTSDDRQQDREQLEQTGREVRSRQTPPDETRHE